jgi:hypothetical protein
MSALATPLDLDSATGRVSAPPRGVALVCFRDHASDPAFHVALESVLQALCSAHGLRLILADASDPGRRRALALKVLPCVRLYRRRRLVEEVTGRFLVTSKLRELAARAACDTETWSRAPRLPHARSRAATVELGGAGVLVSGGVNGVALPNVDVLRPGAPAWTPLPPLREARFAHTATTLLDGRVLVAGGSGVRRYLNEIEIIDPEGERPSVRGALSMGRASHTATRLSDGRVLVVGGHAKRTHRWSSEADIVAVAPAEAELWCPADGTSRATEMPAHARVGHTATLLADGRIVVLGGRPATAYTPQLRTVIPSAETWDPATERWAEAMAPAARAFHTATLLADGRVLIAGGADRHRTLSTAELYDPRTGAFTPTGPLEFGRSNHGATLLADGRVLVVGGVCGHHSLSSAEVWDPKTGTWRVVAYLGSPRSCHALVHGRAGELLAVGGTYEGRPVDAVEVISLRRGARTECVGD